MSSPCQLEYVIGCFLFTEGEYKAAHGHLMKTQELLAGVQGPSEVDVGKLRGFLLACEGMSGAGGEEEKAERKGRGKKGKHVLSVNALEKCLRVKDYQVREGEGDGGREGGREGEGDGGREGGRESKARVVSEYS